MTVDFSKLPYLTGQLKKAELYGDLSGLIQALRDGGIALQNDTEARNFLADILENKPVRKKRRALDKDRHIRNVNIIANVGCLVAMGYPEYHSEGGDTITACSAHMDKYNLSHDSIKSIWKKRASILEIDPTHKMWVEIEIDHYCHVYFYNSKKKVGLDKIPALVQKYSKDDTPFNYTERIEALRITYSILYGALNDS